MRPIVVPPRPPSPGFTLIELLITVAIIGVLASIAYPSFMDSLRKSRRSDAVAALSRVQQAQERFRANNASYATAFDASGADKAKLKLSSTSPDGHYTLAIPDASSTSYTVTATANSSSPQASDKRCHVLQVVMNDQTGLVQYGSSDDGGTLNTSANNPCWVK